MSLSSVQRTTGRSSVAAAAYISGQSIRDDRQSKTFNYRRKDRVVDSEVFDPQGGVLDREAFWNSVERHHKRGDAVTARTIEVALPPELHRQSAIWLARSFAQEIAKHYHVGVDVAVHKGTNGYLHAHLMASACRVNEDGSLGKKVLELDAKHCQFHGLETPADILRPYWADYCNAKLKEKGIEARIDHRSYEERGIDRIPQVKVGHGPGAEARRVINEQIKITNQIREAEEIAAERERREAARRKAEEIKAERKKAEEIEAIKRGEAHRKRLQELKDAWSKTPEGIEARRKADEAEAMRKAERQRLEAERKKAEEIEARRKAEQIEANKTPEEREADRKAEAAVKRMAETRAASLRADKIEREREEREREERERKRKRDRDRGGYGY